MSDRRAYYAEWYRRNLEKNRAKRREYACKHPRKRTRSPMDYKIRSIARSYGINHAEARKLLGYPPGRNNTKIET